MPKSIKILISIPIVIIFLISLYGLVVVKSGKTKEELGMEFLPDWLVPEIKIEKHFIGKLQGIEVDKGSFLDVVSSKVVTTKGVFQVNGTASFNFADELRVEIRGRFANRTNFLCQNKKCYNLIGEFE